MELHSGKFALFELSAVCRRMHVNRVDADGIDSIEGFRINGYRLLRKSNKQYQLIRIINELVPFVKIISNYIVFIAKTSNQSTTCHHARTHYPGRTITQSRPFALRGETHFVIVTDLISPGHKQKPISSFCCTLPALPPWKARAR